MFKVAIIVLLISVVAHALPTSMDEVVESSVSDVMQATQAVVEQFPKIGAVSEVDVELNEENKEAMENAETFGFGYYKTFYPRVYVPSYPILPHYGYFGYPGYVHYY